MEKVAERGIAGCGGEQRGEGQQSTYVRLGSGRERVHNFFLISAHSKSVWLWVLLIHSSRIKCGKVLLRFLPVFNIF